MTFDPTKPVQTRFGSNVEILKTDMAGGFPIVGVITDQHGDESVETWTADGEFIRDSKNKPNNLINTPETHEVVVTLQRRGFDGDIQAVNWTSATNTFWKDIASKRVTFVEGEFED